MAFEAHSRRRFGSLPRTEEAAPPSAPTQRLVAIPIDSYADASLSRERDAAGRTNLRCDACDQKIDGEPAGLGLFMSTRGEEVRFEEPALCSSCATAIGLRANMSSEIEEEEG